MKIKAACLSIVLCLALCCPAFAVDREMNVVFTPEMLATINEHNEKIDMPKFDKPCLWLLECTRVYTSR